MSDENTAGENAHAGSDIEERLTGSDFLGILRRGWALICVVTLAITAVVAAAGFLIPKRFESTILVQPVSNDPAGERMGGIGCAISQIGGLASLAGISSAGDSLKVEAVATLQSEALTERYIKEQNLLPLLYPDKWDSVNHHWKSSDPREIPTLWSANRYFKSRIRDVVENVRTGLVTMTISWRDPQQAAQWANGLVAMTNDYLRDKAIGEADRNITYLEQQASKTGIVSIQQAISNLTEEEIKMSMLARGREQYALEVIDAATVPERATYPQPALWIVMAFLGGLFSSIMLVLLRASSVGSK